MGYLWSKAKNFVTEKGNAKKIFILALVFVLGWLANYTYCSKLGREDLPVSIRQNSSEFQYINPLLFIDNSKEDFSEYKRLEKQMRDYIDESVKNGNASKVSVYFRDLNTSRWGGINERDLYAPSSMLKVAILMSYLKIVENDPGILEEKIWYQRKDVYGEFYKPTRKIEEGYHSVKELLQYMIIDSDNTSMSLLVAFRSKNVVGIYSDLRLPDLLKGSDDFMSAESYSYLFRTLYNATYLRRSYSEEALKILTLTSFDKGIVSGVPSSIKVAHKFGEHTVLTDGKVAERQLHDCGIVYAPDKPYLLCVMTKGTNFADLEQIIGDLSRMVYDFTQNPDNF